MGFGVQITFYFGEKGGMSNIFQNITSPIYQAVKGPTKIYKIPGPGLSTGRHRLFLREKRGAKIFFGRKKRGRRLFLEEKKGGEDFF